MRLHTRTLAIGLGLLVSLALPSFLLAQEEEKKKTPLDFFNELAEQCRTSNALHIKFKLSVITPMGPLNGSCQGQMCKPGFGEMSMHMGDMGEMKFYGDGESIVLVQGKQGFKMGSAWTGDVMPIRLMALFAGEEAKAPGKLDGDRVQVEHDGASEFYTFANGVLKKVEISGGPEQVTLDFEEFAPKRVQDPTTYKRKLPEGVELVDPEEMMGGGELPPLLEPGTDCPEFEVTTHDGKTFKLSSLKGKTVLLNFWFHG